jgi:hypothetical protein
MDQMTPTFSSDHLYVVAFLLCFGHQITSISRCGTRVAFHFTETTELTSDLARFMSGGSVPARQYAFEVLKLKRMIHENNKVEKSKNDGRLDCIASLEIPPR